MRLNKKYLTWLAVVVLFAGCTKNLNQPPQASATRDVVFSSPDGLQLYANSFYDSLPGINDLYKKDGDISDYGAENAIPNLIRPNAFSSRQSSGWTWSKLRNINYFIAGNTSPQVIQTVRDNYTGIAKFFRAYFYYGMVQRFGDVPWIGKPLTVNDTALLYGHRDPHSKVMDSVLADLNYAIGHITTTDPTRSQVTKWVAYGLKSRICLFEGTYQKYQRSDLNAAARWLQEAAGAAKAVIDSGGFSLNMLNGTDMSYRNVFISMAPVASEVMFAIVSNQALAVLNDANWWYTSSTYGVRLNFTRTFINTYLTLNGTPFTDIPGHDTLPFWKETQGRDKRLQQTIRTPGYMRISSGKLVATPPAFNYTYTGYMPIKWCLDDTYYDAGTLNTNSIPFMRYAEILLNYAEARAELGQFVPDDWAKTIGALRQRAGITAWNTLPTVVDPYMKTNYFNDVDDPVLMEIRRERGIELALEGFRFADLTRWKHGELTTKVWTGMYVPAINQLLDLDQDGNPDVYFYQGTTAPGNLKGVTYISVSGASQKLEHGTYGEIHWLEDLTPQWDNKFYLYPIPYNDLQLNPNLGQNPGWD
ncbi:MAG: RagB/SusD family nutrient uptake outer membrane protein [Chitinophagaceae bacterium]|nr:RagB/SusD family nutrient uptake outer membrane protein [Chitinophagaceae bacterium]